MRHARLVIGLIALAPLYPIVACGSSALPHPTYVPQSTSALEEVPYPPPPGRVEVIPPRPSPSAVSAALAAWPGGYDGGAGGAALSLVWLDGSWRWSGRHWMWRSGRWLAVPKGLVYAPWTTVRRDDGALFFAPGAWRDAEGHEAEEPPTLAVALTSPQGDAAPLEAREAREAHTSNEMLDAAPLPFPEDAQPTMPEVNDAAAE